MKEKGAGHEKEDFESFGSNGFCDMFVFACRLQQ